MRFLYLFGFLLIGACSDLEEAVTKPSEMHFATTETCKDYTSEQLALRSNALDFRFVFSEVEITLVEAKSIVGFFTLSSDHLDWTKLAEIWFEVTKQCYSTSSISISLNTQEWLLLEKQLVESGVAAESYNAVLKDGKLTIFFKGTFEE